jgi:Domain of unknown function (DUF4282)
VAAGTTFHVDFVCPEKLQGLPLRPGSVSSEFEAQGKAIAGSAPAQPSEGTTMLQDFLKFDKYLTPVIIRFFYFLQIALIALAGIGSLLSSLLLLPHAPLSALASLIGTIVGVAFGFIAARILTEIIMVLFQNNEHLAVLRARAEGR